MPPEHQTPGHPFCTVQDTHLAGRAIGTPAHITELCVARQASYLRGMGAARALFERKAA